MAQNDRFASPVNDVWLAQHIEPTLEPDLPMVDPHHHLWVRDSNTYLLPGLLTDLASGHNVQATVYEECHSMYRADEPEEERSLGETKFVIGIAVTSASGMIDPTLADDILAADYALS